jgi:formiminotetrahydrofolate cyclodeaminase
MDKQRRYEVQHIVDRLNKIISDLNDLADEEESAFNSRPTGLQSSVSGDDSKEAFEDIRLAAAKINMEIETLRDVATPRPSFKKA